MKKASVVMLAIAIVLAILVRVRTHEVPEVRTAKFGDSSAMADIPKGGKVTADIGSWPTEVIRDKTDAVVREGDFVDLVCEASLQPQLKSGTTFGVWGKADLKDFSFAVTLLPDWDTWTPRGSKINLFQGYVAIQSVGKESDQFLRSLAKAYGLDVVPKHMAPVTIAGGIVLMGDPKRPKERLRIKLFFGDDGTRDYGELYLRIDESKRWLTLEEKGTDYRSAIVRALERGSPEPSKK